jgi:hypothetical protein
MLHINFFFGRTVSNVIVGPEIILKFSDFSMVFPESIQGNMDSFEILIGQKFLYVMRQREVIYFHFSSSQYIIFPSEMANRKKIKLVNKNRESVFSVDDESDF